MSEINDETSNQKPPFLLIFYENHLTWNNDPFIFQKVAVQNRGVRVSLISYR